MATYYDDALPLFAEIVKDVLGEEGLLKNLVLRDATGRLTLVLRGQIEPHHYQEIVARAEKLHPYVNAGEAISSPEDLFDQTLGEKGVGRLEYVDHPAFEGFVRVMERRIIGQDWLTPPRESIPGLPPVVVFASHKGGVGRSTALAVLAADLASTDLNVLVIDLDLEAPGVGGMLLNESDVPEFGALDFFVENGLQRPDDSFVENLIGVGRLARGRGLVHVIPATGQSSRRQPQNVLGKISRAYLDDAQVDGSTKSFLIQTRDLLITANGRAKYDVILVDVRAGLSETSAAALLGLGADILLFGIDTPQTYEGYRYLLSHLASFKPDEDAENDWRFKIKMVQAKAPASSDAWKRFRNSTFELFATRFYDEDSTGADFNFDIDDPQAPHFAWTILNDNNYSQFDPIENEALLSTELYRRTFGDFIEGLRDRLNLVRPIGD